MNKPEAIKERAKQFDGLYARHPANGIKANEDRAYLLRLEKYVQHMRTCNMNYSRSCDCGLTAILEEQE